MFDVNGFIMKTLKGMVGHYPDFQAREYALNWYEKGKITEADLATVEALIESQYVETETETTETEEVLEEPTTE